MTVDIKVKKLNKLAKLPTRGSKYAAGYDLYAATDIELQIPPQSSIKIGTGLAFELPRDTFLAIYARSGLALNQGLRPANAVGVIDSDYRGECIVALYNDSNKFQYISPGERIAQAVLCPYVKMDFTEVDELEDTARGSGGFGSTGKK